MVEKSLGSVGNRTAISRLSIEQLDHSQNWYCTSIRVLNVHIFKLPKQFTGFEACVAVRLRPSLLCDVTQLTLSLVWNHTIGHLVHYECLTLEDWTSRLSPNRGKRTTNIAASHPGIAKESHQNICVSDMVLCGNDLTCVLCHTHINVWRVSCEDFSALQGMNNCYVTESFLSRRYGVIPIFSLHIPHVRGRTQKTQTGFGDFFLFVHECSPARWV
jgi:hypothetical protein